jgi:probable F420-dependent oxidoreductase
MRLGFVIPQVGAEVGPESVERCVGVAESLGYDSLWVLDRLLFPVNPRAQYPASADGTLPESYRRVMDPLALLTYASALSRTLNLGTSILNLPWYNPVLLGRQLATIDVLSGGRLCLGIGTGWCPEEYEAAGVAWGERGRRTDEAIELLRKLWKDSPVSHQGDFFELAESVVDLKPVRRDIPLYMAAFTPPALRRVAEQGSGWMPVGLPISVMMEMFDGLRRMADEAGRSGDQLELIVRANVTVLPADAGAQRVPFVGSLEEIKADIAATREAGAHELLFDPQFSPDLGDMDDFFLKMEQFHDMAAA